MKEYKILLDSSEKLKSFSKFVIEFACPINALEGRKVVNAKNISKLILLNLDNPINVHVYFTKIEEYINFENGIREYTYE